MSLTLQKRTSQIVNSNPTTTMYKDVKPQLVTINLNKEGPTKNIFRGSSLSPRSNQYKDMEIYLIKKRAGLVEQSFMKNLAKLPQIDLLSLQ